MEQFASHIAGDPRAGGSPCSHSAAEIPCLAPQGTWPPRESRGRVRALRQAGCHPWLRDILYLHAHHSRPYSQFMGKHGNKWGAGQAPWQKERQGQGQQSEPSAYWSYWSGAWKGATQPAKQDETQGDSSLQQFPSYSQLKLPNSQQTSKSSDVAQDLSDVEEVGVTDYVKLLQKLLNGARRADAKLRKLSADKDNKMAQWEEFQRVMKNKFIEQRNLYNRDIKSIDKEVSTLTAHKHDVLRQIQAASKLGSSLDGSSWDRLPMPSAPLRGGGLWCPRTRHCSHSRLAGGRRRRSQRLAQSLHVRQ